MKRYLCVICIAVIIILCTVPSFALDESFMFENQMQSEGSNALTVSELDMITAIQQKSDQQLEDEGCTPEEIAKLRSLNLAEVSLERAQLPYERLYAMGYTRERAELLKSYSDAISLDEETLRLLSATITCSISCVYTGDKKFDDNSCTMSFNWTWSEVPGWTLTDHVGVRWHGINYSGTDLDLVCDNIAGSRSAEIDYYDMYNGGFFKVIEYSVSGDDEFNSLRCDFPVIQYDSGFTLWAKSGQLTWTVTNETIPLIPINYIKVQGTYGQECLNIMIGGVDVSYSGDVGVSFDPTYAIIIIL